MLFPVSFRLVEKVGRKFVLHGALAQASLGNQLFVINTGPWQFNDAFAAQLPQTRLASFLISPTLAKSEQIKVLQHLNGYKGLENVSLDNLTARGEGTFSWVTDPVLAFQTTFPIYPNQPSTSRYYLLEYINHRGIKCRSIVIEVSGENVCKAYANWLKCLDEEMQSFVVFNQGPPTHAPHREFAAYDAMGYMWERLHPGENKYRTVPEVLGSLLLK